MIKSASIIYHNKTACDGAISDTINTNLINVLYTIRKSVISCKLDMILTFAVSVVVSVGSAQRFEQNSEDQAGSLDSSQS